MMEQSLKDKTVRGVGWSAADAILGHGVTFLVGIVLARILSPSEYGLIGIVTIFTTVLTGIVDSGFSNSLIRKTDTSDDDYNTMFITNLVLSVFLYGLLFFLAPFIARFFGRIELVDVTRVLGLILIFQALSIVQNTILIKHIDFKTRTKASLISAVLSGTIGIALAFWGFGVWALVFQLLSRQLLYTISLWIFNKWWPNFRFSINSFRYMWGFGWKLMVSGLLNSIWNQLNQTVVGKFYSPESLGQFSRSKEYADLLSVNFTAIIKRVTYPALSEVQNEKERLVAAYRKVIKTTMFVTAVSMFFMGAASEPLLYCLIGPQWHEAATYLPFICFEMSFYPLHALNLNMLQVQGRSDLFLILEIIKRVIAILPILLGIFINIYWMLIGSIITCIISFFLNAYYTGKDLGYSSFMQLKDIAPSYSLATVVALSVFFLKYLPLSFYVILPIQLLIGAIVFILVCRMIKMEEYNEVKGIATTYTRMLFSKIKN